MKSEIHELISWTAGTKQRIRKKSCSTAGKAGRGAYIAKCIQSRADALANLLPEQGGSRKGMRPLGNETGRAKVSPPVKPTEGFYVEEKRTARWLR